MPYPRAFALLVSIAAVVTAYAADAPPPLQLTLSGRDVHVANATAGGRIVLFTASLTTHDSQLLERSGARMFADEDRDGTVSYRRRDAIPLRSVWIAVDVETGRYAVATPSGFPSPVVAFPSNLLKREADGIVGLFENEQTTAEMLVVRPKEGAWRLRAVEGDSGDADRSHNGKLSLAAADASPVGTTTGAPKRLKNGDVIAVIDPRRLDTVITEIGKE